MSPFILSFADGTTFFVGLAMTLIAELLLWRFSPKKGLFRITLHVAVMVGLVFVVISATPQPIWAYGVWILSVFAAWVLLNLGRLPKWPRILAMAAMTAATLGLGIAEIPYRRVPHLAASKTDAVYVIGDSISAGMGTPCRCWPEMLGDMSGLNVVNLSLPGATVQSAAEQARRITDPRAIVIVEIGGNDLLSGLASDVFRERLDTLVSSLHARGHRVLLVELPLLPFQNGYGRAQREMAARYDAALLPKRGFTRVLGTPDATLDGLHLSPKGHRELATIMADVLQGK